MPVWWDRFLNMVFGGTYSSQGGRKDYVDGGQEMSTFRDRISSHRASSMAGYRQPLAPGFDYMRWKPRGKHRMRYNPEEYTRQCNLLAPYVRDVTYAAWLGVEERRWAGLGGEPPPIPLAYSKSGTLRSFGGSRDTLGN